MSVNSEIDGPFRSAHSKVRIAYDVAGSSCLRNSQVGALHSIAAHFTLRDSPGMVVLPTGAGKTAVLMLVPYVLRARRVLVITPSRFVRSQITKDFAALKTPKVLGALPMEVPAPTVFEVDSALSTLEAWSRLSEFDVVVTTPNSASPGIESVVPPPADLFDLVLVDEAHHGPARTWRALVEAFPSAYAVFFTATPFRKDRQEISARLVYSYSIQRAFDDGIYGEMEYIPVTPPPGVAPDIALARDAARVLRTDQQAGHNHSLMVRAESRQRATDLLSVYQTETDLKLEVVHSGHSEGWVRKAVTKLRDGTLDGVICVNMFSEGFDLPRLKLAALHAPHRSLAVTLQFFGRFARVGDNLGSAKFLAVPQEISGDLEHLFLESDAWGRKIRQIGEEAVGEAVATHEMLRGFENLATDDKKPRLGDVSVGSFVVFNHVRAHQVHGKVDLSAEAKVLGFTTEKRWVNENDSTVVLLLRDEVRPEWARTPGLESIEYHLVVIYWDEATSVLFVSSSLREDAVYKDVIASYVEGNARSLSLHRANRVLRAFNDLELYHIGIRNRATGRVAESYRQISGAAAHKALDRTDAILYHRGHIFGKGMTGTVQSTIGVSSLGKIWRNDYTGVPRLVAWCRQLAKEIDNSAPFSTGIAIDDFDTGEDIQEIPDIPIIAADWGERVYQQPWKIELAGRAGPGLSILDADLVVQPQRRDSSSIELAIVTEAYRSRLLYSISPVPRFQYVDEAQPRLEVLRGFGRKDLIAFLSDEHIRFHFADGSVVQGTERYCLPEDIQPFDAERFAEEVKWSDENVDITKELEPGNDGFAEPLAGSPRSIQNWLANFLKASPIEYLVWDHRPGECADFIAFHQTEGNMLAICLYHCKGSSSSKPGNRVADAFDVCGQAVKSARFRNRQVLIRHLQKRSQAGSQVLKGDEPRLISMLKDDARYEIPLRVFIVQPSFSKSSLSAKIATLLAAVSRSLVSQGCDELRVICSP